MDCEHDDEWTWNMSVENGAKLVQLSWKNVGKESSANGLLVAD